MKKRIEAYSTEQRLTLFEWLIEDFSRIVWREDDSVERFIKEFLAEGENEAEYYQLLDVSWSSVAMNVRYSFTGIGVSTSNFSIYLWYDYYKKNQKQEYYEAKGKRNGQTNMRNNQGE